MNTPDGAAQSVSQVCEHWAVPTSSLKSSSTTALWVGTAARSCDCQSVGTYPRGGMISGLRVPSGAGVVLLTSAKATAPVLLG